MATATVNGNKFDLGAFIPPVARDQVASTEIEFVHDGKGETKLSGADSAKGTTVTERIQQGAPPHLIVTIRTKPREAGSDRLLDNYGVEPTFTMLGRTDLRFNERNSIPLLGTLPAGDAPKTIAEGAVATG